MDGSTFQGSYFDGHTSLAQQVEVYIFANGDLRISAENNIQNTVYATDYSCSAPIAKSAIRINIKGGALLELPFAAGETRGLKQQNNSWMRLVHSLEEKSHLILLLLIAAAALCFAIYYYFLPITVSLLKPLVPLSAKEVVGEQVLKLLDKSMLSPSSLSNEQQQAAVFQVKRTGQALQPPLDLNIYIRAWGGRKSEDKIANALALLPNTVILTDALIKLLSEDELVGVAAHELGHLVLDHGTEQLIRATEISILSVLLFGGEPGMIQASALSVLNSSFSREQERQADAFAVSLLKKMGKDPRALARALSSLEEQSQDKSEDKEDSLSFLSTHPITSERIAWIEKNSGK